MKKRKGLCFAGFKNSTMMLRHVRHYKPAIMLDAALFPIRNRYFGEDPQMEV
jgi:hypothetical protein